jgi:hypothetical protein
MQTIQVAVVLARSAWSHVAMAPVEDRLAVMESRLMIWMFP